MADEAKKPATVSVRLLASMAGDRCSWSVGDVRDVPAAEAARLVAAGLAEAVVAAKAK